MGPERAAKSHACHYHPQLGVLCYWQPWVYCRRWPHCCFNCRSAAGDAWFLTNPRQLAPWHNGVGVTQYVAGMMVSALAMEVILAELKLSHGLPLFDWG